MGYLRKTLFGLSWVGLLRVVSRILAFVRTAILARLLTPYDFGLFGIAALVLGILDIFTETGINTILIQENEKKLVSYLNSAWVVSVARGLLIAVTIFSSAPLIADFFNSPEAVSIIRLIALVPLIKGFINPAIVLFQKRLDFNKEFWFRSFLFLADTLIVLIFAFVTGSPVSLVIGMIFSALFEVFLSLYLVKPRPSFQFDKNKVTHIFHQGKWITLIGILSYIYRQGPDFLVGRFISTTGLGIFQISNKISASLGSEVIDMFNRVTFPVYVEIAEDRERVKKAFIKNSLAVFFIVLPLALVLMLFPELIVRIILGEQWLLAVPLLPVFALYILVSSIAAPGSAVMLAFKKQNYLFYEMLVSTGILAIVIWPLITRFGLIGAVYAQVLASALVLPLHLYLIYLLLKGDTGDRENIVSTSQ